ncbi:MAG: AAA family ATPase [Clostridiaceae bacterium]|nr:AAA family ATPase [Clostridiaceae bacterium]
MSGIKLKRLILKNFKGIKDLTIDFKNVTNIYGENKLGKTTIFDGFTWLLFDKDSKDRSKFEVQPLDDKNNVIHMIETEVIGVLEVDGKTMEIKKILREKWVKKRGEVDSELKGTETLYYINEVPVKLSEYKEKINNIVDEKLFKLISSPLYFSLNMKWEERRKVIQDIIGDITAESVVNYNASLKPLIKLLKDTDLETFKKTISARIKKLNEDKRSIPYRIDELNKSICSEIDFDALAYRKRGILGGIKSIQEKLMDSSKLNEDLLKEKNRLYEIKSKLRDMEYKAEDEVKWNLKQSNSEMRDIENSILKNESSMDRIKITIKNNETKVLDLDNVMKKLRNDYEILQGQELVMKEDEFLCPTCGRHFDADDIETKKQEMRVSYIKNKDKELTKINTEGQGKRALQEKLQADTVTAQGELDTYIDKLNELIISKAEKEKLFLILALRWI